MEPIEVAIAIVIDRGRALISQRRVGEHLGGFWEFPGGKVEPGESPADAAMREVREETGLAVRVIEALEPIRWRYPTRRVLLHPFLCKRVSGVARPIGASRTKWVRIADLAKYRFPPANATLLRELSARFCASQH